MELTRAERYALSMRATLCLIELAVQRTQPGAHERSHETVALREVARLVADHKREWEGGSWQ